MSFQPIISFVVAADEGGVIGKANQLPWHLPNDLKYFKNLTWAMPILMGRKTFESIGKPLPGRQSIVITRNGDWQYPGVLVVHSVAEALEAAKTAGVKEIFVIGGAEIFASAMPQAQRLYLTRVHHRFDGDVFLPSIDDSEWNLVREQHCSADEKNAYAHTFQVWERIEG
ncbi:dihydrofolate reductase [Pseudocnuella soli]|uniref:dihydrofolate reductase n=1 Tax=Pseudocnuella soli TaxID=2502779 RepID=UPI001051EBAE|nr:dihydrofolate reductase [Pseudocnuella soli]